MKMPVMRFMLKLALALAIVFVVNALLLGRSAALQFLDDHRPGQSQLSALAWIESQALHVEAEASRPAPTAGRVVFAGSSSVVNGIDVFRIRDTWRMNGVDVWPVNYGLTSFSAAELPFLTDQLLARDVRLVVFPYNTFSFPDRFHPQAINARWKTAEFFREAPWRMILSPAFPISRPVLGDILPLVRFDRLLAEIIILRLKRLPTRPPASYDYPDNEPMRPAADKRLTPPRRINPREYLQGIYLDSDRDGHTLGYDGLSRFLDLARLKNIPVILMPVPEPDFGYRYGIRRERIDRHVGRIAAEFGVPEWPHLREIERNDSLFRDNVHLHSIGRERYSDWLARAIEPILEHCVLIVPTIVHAPAEKFVFAEEQRCVLQRVKQFPPQM